MRIVLDSFTQPSSRPPSTHSEIKLPNVGSMIRTEPANVLTRSADLQVCQGYQGDAFGWDDIGMD